MKKDQIKERFLKKGATRVYTTNVSNPIIRIGNNEFTVYVPTPGSGLTVIAIYEKEMPTDELWLRMSLRFTLNGCFSIMNGHEKIDTIAGKYNVLSGPHTLPYNLIVLERK